MTKYGVNIRIDRTFTDKSSFPDNTVYKKGSEDSPKEQYEDQYAEVPAQVNEFMKTVQEELGVGYGDIDQHKTRDKDRSDA